MTIKYTRNNTDVRLIYTFLFYRLDWLFCLIIVQSNARNRIFMTLYAYKGSIIILQAQLIAYNLAFFPPIMRLCKKQEFTQQEPPYELTLCS